MTRRWRIPGLYWCCRRVFWVCCCSWLVRFWRILYHWCCPAFLARVLIFFILVAEESILFYVSLQIASYCRPLSSLTVLLCEEKAFLTGVHHTPVRVLHFSAFSDYQKSEFHFLFRHHLYQKIMAGLVCRVWVQLCQVKHTLYFAILCICSFRSR